MSEVDEPEEMEVDPPVGKENIRKLTRGEKSKIAAKGRRDKEHIAMTELMKELPIADKVLLKMDKASIIKVATCYLKIKHYVQKDLALHGHQALTNGNTAKGNNTTALQTKNYSELGTIKEGKVILEAINGFLIFVNRKGSIRFVSNTIEDHLGLKQENLIGKNVFDSIHESDHQELHKQFTEDKKFDTASTYCQDDEPKRVFYLRMKFNLPKPGTKTKHTGYMLVQWSGKMKRHISMKLGTVVTDGLLCICRPMQTTPVLEIRMDGNMFMSRHDLGMTFTFCDTRILTLIGYEPNEVVGKTAYHFHNPIDAPVVGDCHQKLIIKGTSVSKYYRFLGKTGDWVWLQTRATIIYNTANKPQYIVCMNYVISEEEGERYLMLEEHQQANQLAENTVLTLPDNQHTLPVSHFNQFSQQHSGVKIVELEDENLEKTACFNGELDQKEAANQAQTSGQLLRQPSVGMTGFQATCAGADSTAVVPPGQVVAPVSSCQPIVGNQEISQTAVAGVPDLTVPVSTPGLDNSSNTVSLDPRIQSYVDVCSPESSASTYTGSMCYPPATDQYACGPGDRTMAQCASSSHSDDAGYESATSPYNSSYFSPQMVSPGPNYTDTPDIDNSRNFIQGQNCSFGLGYGAVPQNNTNLLQGGDNSMDVVDSNTELANPVLDDILQSLNQPTADSLDVNMALVYSTMESLTSTTPTSVSTSMKSPKPNTYEVLKDTLKPPIFAENPVPYQANKPAERTDKPLLRSFLTMPQESLPSQPPAGFLQMFKNGSKSTALHKGSKFPCVSDRQSNVSAHIQGQSTSRGSSMRPSETGGENLPAKVNNSMDNGESYDFDEIPECALEYLMNEITDAQAQALIADLQGDGDLQNDSFMDTSESDFTKDFVASLENQTLTSDANCERNNSGATGGCNIPFSNCKTFVGTLGGAIKCNTNQTSSNVLFSGLPAQPVNHSYQSSNGMSGHDHVYHQSLNRLNGQNRSKCQKSIENRLANTYIRGNGQQQQSCGSQTQTQTSEHCMSELERHLRNRLSSRVSTCSDAHDQCMNSNKPFLQQLLTGELTNDMYIKMEKKRMEDKSVKP